MNTPYFIQLLANAGLTAAVVFIPFWASNLGFTHSNIGLLVATYQGSMFFSNLLFGRWADLSDRKKFVVTGLGLSSMVMVLHCLAVTPSVLFLLRALIGISAGIFPAALLAYFYSDNCNLGRFSGFGSLGWAAGALIVGFITDQHLFLVAALMLLLTAALAQLRLKPQPAVLRQSFFNLKVFSRNWLIYLTFLLRHLGAFSIWTIFPLYLADLGANRFWVGVIYALNPLAQFLFMNILEPVRDAILIRTGLLLSVIVFVAFGLARHFSQVIPVQLALALSWSCLYLGTLKQLLRQNEEKSTASGMLQSVLSLAAICGALLEGVTGKFGYQAIMFAAAGVALLGTLLYFLAPKTETN